MELYKFRALENKKDLERIKSILNEGFYCSKFFDFNDVNEGVFPTNNNPSNVNLNEKQQYKICSLSKKEALTSQLMWGHYANAGMGVAIEIITQHNDLEKLDLYKVNYERNLRKYDTVIDILVNKSKEWEYEHEIRYLKKTNCNFFKHEISKIYFGTPFEKLANYEKIKSKHINLQKYLDLKDELKNTCDKLRIPCVNYNFA